MWFAHRTNDPSDPRWGGGTRRWREARMRAAGLIVDPVTTPLAETKWDSITLAIAGVMVIVGAVIVGFVVGMWVL